MSGHDCGHVKMTGHILVKCVVRGWSVTSQWAVCDRSWVVCDRSWVVFAQCVNWATTARPTNHPLTSHFTSTWLVSDHPWPVTDRPLTGHRLPPDHSFYKYVTGHLHMTAVMTTHFTSMRPVNWLAGRAKCVNYVMLMTCQYDKNSGIRSQNFFWPENILAKVPLVSNSSIYSAKTWAIWAFRDSFGILRTCRFQNCPWWA